MTEQEIIRYLKENRNKGVAFGFMPEEVKAWCGFHSPDEILSVFDGVWSEPCEITCFGSGDVYCLDENYEPKPEFKAHYEEFEIKNGRFSDGKIFYLWHQWADFLTCNHTKYNNFGGWLFNDKLWSTKVLMTDIADRELFGAAAKDDKTVAPVTPTKIKFWRFAE